MKLKKTKDTTNVPGNVCCLVVMHLQSSCSQKPQSFKEREEMPPVIGAAQQSTIKQII